jgi:GT2 family glycosyltransferase
MAEFEPADSSLRKLAKGYNAAICMFRRSALSEVNYFDRAPKRAEDYYLAARLASAGYGNLYVAKPLASYRFWEANNHWSYSKRLEELEGLVQVYDTVLLPAFRQRGWPLTPLYRVRRKRASQECSLLAYAQAACPQNRLRIEELLSQLAGNTLRLHWRIKLYRLGFAPMLLSCLRYKNRARKIVINRVLGAQALMRAIRPTEKRS